VTVGELKVGDVVDVYGIHRTVAEVEVFRDPHGYPMVAVTFTDGSYLMKAPSAPVTVV
jgi:hypothetical protein